MSNFTDGLVKHREVFSLLSSAQRSFLIARQIESLTTPLHIKIL